MTYTRTFLSVFCAILLFAIFPVNGFPSMCWWDIEKGVVDELATTDIVSLACSFNSGCLDNNSESCLRWLNILIRAGHRRQAEETITHLSKIYYEESWRWLDPVCDSLIERREIGLARRFLELLPLAEPSRVYDLLKAWEDEGASENEIDNWLAARAAVNYPFWMKARCWFRARHGTEEELLKIIEGEVRIAPEDTVKAFLYLDAVSWSPHPPSIDWLGEVCKPRLARESLELGDRLKSRGAHRAAISLFEHSLATPITDEDIHLQGAPQMVQMPIDIEKAIRQHAIYSLIECYKQVGETGKAKQLLDDLLRKMKETNQHDLWLARMKGEMELQAGDERTTESALLIEEAEKTGSADYWRQRANYYIGRKDDAKVIEAYQKALELAKPQPSPCRTKCPITLRGAILGDYWQDLAMNKRIEEAASLLLKELREVPAEMQSAHAAACGLLRLNDYKQYHCPLNPEEPVIWSYLEANDEWDYTQYGLLRIMLKHAPEEKRDMLVSRAESLAQGAHPDRQAAVGNILSEMDMPLRAIPLLESAFRHMKKSARDSCVAFTLFCAYLSVGEWNKAENMLPDIRTQMSPGMLMDYMGRLAISAAQAGAVRDAIRLWHGRCNLDLTDFCGLDDLAQKGLRDTLRDYYLSLKKRDPESWVPDSALSKLQ